MRKYFLYVITLFICAVIGIFLALWLYSIYGDYFLQ